MLNQETIELFMKAALEQARLAVTQGEVPVGCVFVEFKETQGLQIIKRGHNETNQTKNASQHAEMICLKQLEREGRLDISPHLYLFVTVEPCIMCAKALDIVGIKHAYFGQYNDRFGGCGSVMKLNSYPADGGYLQDESNTLLKEFYEKGNQTLPIEQRNRKRVKD